MTAQDVAREILPTLNACLNGTSALLVLAAFVAIRRKNVALHRALMVGALVSSTAFLASYVTRMSLVGSVSFQGVGAVRAVYLTILFSHMVLAVIVVPLVLVTLVRALRRRFPQHKRIARFTLPVWLYVSVTGVVVYFMLYHWPTNPAVSRPACSGRARVSAVVPRHPVDRPPTATPSAETAQIPGSTAALAALTWPGRPGMVGPRLGTPASEISSPTRAPARGAEGNTR